MTELTDAECDAFRALPLDFNGMVRAIYAAGAARSADTSGARWYCLSREGMATLCVDEQDAASVATQSDFSWPNSGPHRAVQMVAVAAPGGQAGALRPDENSPSGPSDRALNSQPEAVDHDRGAR